MALTARPLSLASTPGHLRMVELCYRYAYLEGRRRLGRTLDAEESAELLLARKLLEGDTDSSPKRRAHRRFPVLLPATIKTPQGLRNAVILNLSADGLFIATTSTVELGTTVQVRLDTPSGVEYVFTCTVVRREDGEQLAGLGLSLCCVPLEMRHRRAA